MPWLCLPASSTKDSSIVSSTGPISTPWRRSTHMSYLMFWPTFSTAGSSSRGFSFAIAFLSGSWPGSSLPSPSLAPPPPQVERALRLAARRAMADRQVGGAPPGGIDVAPRALEQRQRHADQAGIVGIERVGLAVEGDDAGPGRLGDPLVERLLVLDQLVVGGGEGLVGLRRGRRRGPGVRRGPAPCWPAAASRAAPRARSPRPVRR